MEVLFDLFAKLVVKGLVHGLVLTPIEHFGLVPYLATIVVVLLSVLGTYFAWRRRFARSATGGRRKR